MIDGKVCNAITSTTSEQRCYICKATPIEMNQIEKIMNKEIDPTTLRFGLSSNFCCLTSHWPNEESRNIVFRRTILSMCCISTYIFLALRGHREDFSLEGYHGNFLSVVQLVSRYDHLVHQVLKMPKGNEKFLILVFQSFKINFRYFCF